MLISLNWLKEYVDFDVPVNELAHALTMLGIEIESISCPGKDITNVVVGKIESIEPHPDADKIVVCKTDVGEEESAQIICGAKNMKVGDKVPTAKVGSTLPGGFKITKRKMRGIVSHGMMCSPDELGVGDGNSSGLMILDPELPIGEDVVPLLGLDDTIFEIEVTPNRGDWSSMIGVAREVAALLGKELKLPEVSITESETPASDAASVTIKNPDLCPRYIGRVLTDVKVGPSPAWMVQRLISAGQRPINNVVDITNFVLLETGHPLHAFDLENLKGHSIIVRNANDGESMTTLDDQERKLQPEMLVIADAEKPVALAGVMGGQNSEVGETTTSLLLESAYFEPTSIRKTARALNLQTESSARFQRGADPEMAEFAINRAASLIQTLAGAKVSQGLLDEYPKPLKQNDIQLRFDRSNLLLGANIDADFQMKALVSLGFELLESDETSCTVRTPTWRHDASLEADLIEEVARLYGYENIESHVPMLHQSEEVFAPDDTSLRNLRHFLVGQGLTEFMSWTFTSDDAIEKTGLDEIHSEFVKLLNPLSEQQAGMRPSILPAMLAAVSRNLRHGMTDVHAFELGPVYAPDENADTLSQQSENIVIALTGRAEPGHWSVNSRETDFYDIKGYAEEILHHLGVKFAIEEGLYAPLQADTSASIKVGKSTIGYFGQLCKAVMLAHEIEQPVFVLELTLDGLLTQEGSETQFQPIAKFPPSLRDIAVLVDAATPSAELVEAAQKAGTKLLKSVEIFDIYTGKQIPEDKKSVAIGLVFQSDERTLTEKDTQKAYDRILKRFEKDFQAQLR